MTGVRQPAWPYTLVCEDTSALPREEWLALRQQGIGSSDAAPAMGLSPWSDAYTLWAEKAGVLPYREQDEVERFVWGHLMEPIIIAEGQRRGVIGECQQHLMLRSVPYPHLLANPDAIGKGFIVEVKTADGWDEKRWNEGVPDHYVIQAQHLMIVTGAPYVVFLVLFGGNHLRAFEVAWDDALADTMLSALADFWRRVQENDAPDPDGSESAMRTVRDRYLAFEEGGVVELTGEQMALVEDFQMLDLLAKEDRKRADAIKARLMVVLGEAEADTGLFGEDGPVVTWRADKNGKRTMRFPDRKGKR